METTYTKSQIIVMLVATLATLVLVIGCTSVAGKRPMSKPYRDVFGETHHGVLVRDDMRAMARSIRALLVLDTEEGVTAEDRKARVLRELNVLEGTARVIKEEDEIYYYSVFSPYLGSFLHDVSMAREFASQDPPDYQPATGLIKSCLLCHKHI